MKHLISRSSFSGLPVAGLIATGCQGNDFPEVRHKCRVILAEYLTVKDILLQNVFTTYIPVHTLMLNIYTEQL